MATVLDRTMQGLADVTGLIVDRTVVPERIIGQGWIISKSRMVVLASCVANYADAPWALLVKFPYPDLTFSVKAISLHPEFNKRAAREHYLAQANELVPQPLIMENDIATVTFEADILELQPDRVQELTRALSLPLTISPQDLSGVMKAGETGEILQKAILSGRNGVLNFFDERKVPFCRVLIKGGRIMKASFQNLQNEFAICELMWRKPGGNFVLQSNDTLAWTNFPDIAMSTDQLANEAKRRTQDLPRMLDALGGPNARYIRARPGLEGAQINPQIRWVVERIWPVLDGCLPLTKMSERLAIDTYTALQALWEMKHLGLVNTAPADQYHRSGQLGSALTPGHDVDMKFWDGLQAFYLDDLSTVPISAIGNFFGSSRLLSTNTLLHTLPLPACKFGAIILKEGRLVAVHNGKFSANLQNPPPFPLSQMTWIGSLSDMSAKRMRTATAEIDSDGMEEISQAAGRAGSGGLKGRSTMSSMSAYPGDAAGLASQGENGDGPPKVSTEPEILQKFTKIQILGAGGAMFVIGFLMAINSMLSAPKPAVVATAKPDASNSKTSSPAQNQSNSVPSGGEAIKAALQVAGLKDQTLPPFKFADTSKQTSPKLSFGLEAENNQKMLFVVWPNPVISNTVDTCSAQPPFLTLKGVPTNKMLEEGHGTHGFYWKATRYANKDGKDTVALVGAFQSNQADKCILVISEPWKDEGDLDYRGAVNIIEHMFANPEGTVPSDGTSASTSATTTEASSADIDAYRNSTLELIKGAYKAPAESDRANKCVVNFVIDSSGNISKLELKYSSGVDDVDKAVQKAITSKVPYPTPPNTKAAQVPMQVTVDGGEFSIGEP